MQILAKKCLKIDFLKLGFAENQYLDLYNAAKKLSKKYPVKYNPDSGISGMFIKYENLSFCVYASGSICSYGNYPLESKKKAFMRLWGQELGFFLVK